MDQQDIIKITTLEKRSPILPIIKVWHNNIEMLFLVDSGSDICSIDANITDMLLLEPIEEKLDKISGACGDTNDTFAMYKMPIKIGNEDYNIKVVAVDLSNLINGLGLRVRGILGSNFLKTHKCIIDYPNEALYRIQTIPKVEINENGNICYEPEGVISES